MGRDRRVARTPRLSPRFLAQRSTLGIAQGSPASRALGAVLGTGLRGTGSPRPGDSTLLIDPEARGVSLLVHVRRVPGHNLWVWYRQADDFVDFLELTGHPPDR